jgi:glycosyltransferase involved in cell wall biosynthesis
MRQLVSIIIPAYNAERWIRKSIESALAQTWPWKEIIVVDDGSRDRTFEIARKYSSRFVNVITQDNRGASAARNQALMVAQGDYIQWLDADDLLAPDKISRQLEGAEHGKDSRVLLSGGWGQFYLFPEKARFNPTSLWEDLEPAEWLFRKLDQILWMAIESWLVSRKLTELAGPWDESLYRDNDGEYFSRVLLSSTGTRFIPGACCFCRRSTKGISHNLKLDDRKLDSLAFSFFSYIERLRAMEDSPRTQNACIKFLKSVSIYFYPERKDTFCRLQSTVTELGGKLDKPDLRSKYLFLQKVFGWRVAKKAQYALPTLRSLVEINWERIVYLLSSRNKWISLP